VVLRRTRHKIGHFRDVPKANLSAWYENKQNLLVPKGNSVELAARGTAEVDF